MLDREGEITGAHKTQQVEGMLPRENRIIPMIQVVEEVVVKVHKREAAFRLVRPTQVLLDPHLPLQTQNLND